MDPHALSLFAFQLEGEYDAFGKKQDQLFSDGLRELDAALIDAPSEPELYGFSDIEQLDSAVSK